MARTADQIVAEQLGALHLQLVISQARVEAAEEKVAELTACVHVLEAAEPSKEDAETEEDLHAV
ncbi:hypothetical protein LCGC14_2082410 [marine sediment metagenome]|uniref:Uncharacterized protein n=1 Tax=marine sediment metagenome TaxID=412755 RepID=A0A0F9F2F5_9ZZZZ